MFLDVTFIRPFYKMILDQEITLEDMQLVDVEYYQSMIWFQENDPADLDIYFTVEVDKLGTVVTHELKPNGGTTTQTRQTRQTRT
jgi:hypothetical protein